MTLDFFCVIHDRTVILKILLLLLFSSCTYDNAIVSLTIRRVAQSRWNSNSFSWFLTSGKKNASNIAVKYLIMFLNKVKWKEWSQLHIHEIGHNTTSSKVRLIEKTKNALNIQYNEKIHYRSLDR